MWGDLHTHAPDAPCAGLQLAARPRFSVFHSWRQRGIPDVARSLRPRSRCERCRDGRTAPDGSSNSSGSSFLVSSSRITISAGLPLPCGQCRCSSNFSAREVFDPRRHVQKNVDRQGCLQVNKPACREWQVPPGGAPQHVRQVDQLAEHPRIIEPSQHSLVFLGQP